MRRRTALWLAAHLRHRLPWALLWALAAVLWARTLPSASPTDGTASVLLGVVLALAVGAGTVSRDLAGGAVLLWIQKPGRPAAHYGARLLAAGLAAPSLHLLAGAALGVWGILPPSSPGEWAALLLTDGTVVALALLVSAASVPLEAAATALLLVLLAGLGVDAVVAPETLGPWAPWVAAVRFPTLEHRTLGLWLDGVGGPPPPGAWARTALWPLMAGGGALALVEFRLRPRGTAAPGGRDPGSDAAPRREADPPPRG